MIRREILNNEFLLRNATLEDVIQMENVQIQCYPTLNKLEIMNKNHFENHIKIFPEGQIVIELEGTIIGSTSTMRSRFPYEEHTFMETTDNLWITNTHEPNGDWMYGIDMGILPEYRGLGLSRELYLARQEVCSKLKLKGQVIAGMTIGYGNVKDKMTIEEYCYALEIKKFTDPTVTPQRKAGFRWIKPLYNHINDPGSGYTCILMYFPVDENYKIKLDF
ncbi:GNAT family N-acetyltransferase [Flavobacterium sp.]|uniref:GNAT family N-acetyltransferase n=1 Tax=Flavobacterium sp. TaxID=239 RepID=UPI00286D5037|nr:GNAT family N-acetyltransferase [Flavobacterium sp.]